MGIEAIYGNVYLYTVIFLTVILSIIYCKRNYAQVRYGKNSMIVLALILCTCLVYFIGNRPTEGFLFGDSYLYKHRFNMIISDSLPESESESSEWIWQKFTVFCAHNLDLTTYYTIIALGYFGFMLWACKLYSANNILAMFVAILGAFSTYTYGTNGLRNGLACSISLCAIAYMIRPNKSLIKFILLAFLAINIHRSTFLPLFCVVLSTYLVKTYRLALMIWVFSILISLLLGDILADVFIGLGFDERVTTYLTSLDTQKFTHTGFRWDFLIYSMMPILLGYYIIVKRNIYDKPYITLLNTYIIANAFWVMIIRANYSNRFAYLSWFMYAVVLLYPLLRLNIWSNRQGLRVAQIMMAQIGFTWFMETFYW